MLRKSWVIVLFILSGCASQVQAPVYLLLDQPVISSQYEQSFPTRVDVKVSSYLQQPQLAIATGINRIQFSDNYLWAEPLDTALAALLRQQLGQMLATDAKTMSVDVLIRRLSFQPDGKVQMAGEFVVSQSGKKGRYAFNFMKNTGATSYPEMIGSIPILVQRLAEDIAEKL